MSPLPRLLAKHTQESNLKTCKFMSNPCTARAEQRPGIAVSLSPAAEETRCRPHIGGISAPVQYAGGLSGAIADFLQVDLQIPKRLRRAARSRSSVIFIGGRSSQANVTVAIK